MTKKQILVLYSLGVGFLIEVIIIAGLLVSNNQNLAEPSLPTLVSTIALNPGIQTGSVTNGTPVGLLDSDHAPGSEPADSSLNGAIPTLTEDQVLPENPDGPGATDAWTLATDSSPMGAYPAPGAEDANVPVLEPPADSGTPPDNAQPDNAQLDLTQPTAAPQPTDAPPAVEPYSVQPPVQATAQATAEATAQATVQATAEPTQPPVVPTSAPAPESSPVPATPVPATPAPTQAQPTAQPPASHVLVAVPAAAAPALDGAASDAAWASAPAVSITTSGGANHSATQVTVKSVYDGERVYFLFTWADPSLSFLRQPWEKQADGTWKRLTSANGNDENQYYEDKLALFWPVNDSLPGFDTRGCAGACHEGENAKTKPYGNMYTGGTGQRADLWQWKAVRGAGQVDDQYLNNQTYSADTPAAGFHPDPDDGGGYRENQNKDKSAPAVMAPGGGDRSGAPGFINEAEKVALDPSLFQPGNRVPSVITAPFKGDRGDISAAWHYANGQWTLELSRKLVTGSKYDVQFNHLDQTYAFALATFDNAQVRHAVESGATLLKFQR